MARLVSPSWRMTTVTAPVGDKRNRCRFPTDDNVGIRFDTVSGAHNERTMPETRRGGPASRPRRAARELRQVTMGPLAQLSVD